jgi:glycosyltransferase involved in cell wall biosynthesis
MVRVNHTDPLRVAFFDHTAKISGGEIALANLIAHLDRQAVYPVVLLGSEGPLADRLRGKAEVHILPLSESVAGAAKDSLGFATLLRFRQAILLVRYVNRVASFLRRMDIDLVHTNSLKADIIGGLAARRSRIPVIWHLRDRIEPDYLPAVVVRAFRILSRLLPNFIIANSNATLATLPLFGRWQRIAIPSRFIIEERVRVVHDGLQLEDHPEADVHAPKARSVGLIGRISRWKGQHIFIQAAAIVHKQYPDVVFQIIGGALFGEEAYERELHELCRSLDLVDDVEFVGFVENVAPRIAQLEILVHASTTGEPFGQVIIEGMAAAKPVIATDGGGVPEIVQHQITGLLVPMADVARMAEAIAYLLQNPEIGRQMGSRGRERVHDHFTIDKAARKVEAIYKEVLGYFPTETDPLDRLDLVCGSRLDNSLGGGKSECG